tara:strand:+ start:2203 stop:3153 length:951 start_codon:yes stop_codon:yes gene_type:complete
VNIPLAKLDWGTEGFSYAFQQAHLPGVIISGILLALSVISWSVMFSKLSMTAKVARQNYKFVHGFRQASNAMEPHLRKFSVAGAPLFLVYRAACRELSMQLIGTGEVDDTTHARMANAGALTPPQMETVRMAMDRTIGEMVLFLERRMTFLATAVSGAPFLGLLGTVWGVMEVFSRVASSGASASIKLMAPGVAAALVTTVVALLVAIPAMFGYNFLINKIRTLILEMHNFAAELGAMLERQFVDYYALARQGNAAPAASQPHYEQPAASTGFNAQPATGPVANESFPPPSQAREEGGPPINPIAQQARRPRRRPV